MSNHKTPSIRFKEFTDDWEQRKLSYFLEVSTEKNTDNLYTKNDVLSVSGDFGIVNQIEFQGRSFAGASVSNYGVVHTGDVVYTKSPLKANPYGIIKANKGKAGIVSVLYGVYNTKENANADFIQMYFEQDVRLNNYLRPLVNKGAKNTLLISDTDALEGEVCLAPTFDEQEAIGHFFDTIDNLITLHQRKYEKLVNVKKSMLDKMFPKNDFKVPEIRFKGFTDDWEQRKLGDVATFINGRAYSQPELLSSGKYKVLRVGNFYTNDSWYYSDLELGEKYYADYGDLLYTWSATFGPHIWLGDRVIYHYHIWKIDLSNQLEKQFAVQLLEQDKANILSSKNGSTMVHITKEGMEQKDVIIPPSTKEQQEIGAFFQQLDNLITLHQRELEKLQNLKKSLLNSMFI